MLDNSILQEKAREAICSGKLPAERPDRTTWGGTGSGAACAVCDEPVKPDQMELELEFKRQGSGKYRLHSKCFTAWEFELGRIGYAS
jgi:hypothetical protein